MNVLLGTIALSSIRNTSVQSFTLPTRLQKARSPFLSKPFSSRKTISTALACDGGDDSDDEAWDNDVDYDKDEPTSTNNNPGGAPSLGINIGTQLEPLSEAQAQQLRDEATETINAACDERLDEIANMKEELRKDFEMSKENMRFASDLRAKEQTEKLMNKIDKISGDFLAQNEELRSGTKLAARADRNMAGRGMEIGSWGKVGGVDVLTSGGKGEGLLGSVSWGQMEMDDSDSGFSTESSIEVDTKVKGYDESRIMIVCDDKVSTRTEIDCTFRSVEIESNRKLNRVCSSTQLLL